jgi:hypothetical protein
MLASVILYVQITLSFTILILFCLLDWIFIKFFNIIKIQLNYIICVL